MNKEIDQTTTDKKFSEKRLALLGILVLVSAAIVCGLVYWRLNQVIQIKNDQKHTLTEQINTTSKKINTVSKQIDDLSSEEE